MRKRKKILFPKPPKKRQETTLFSESEKLSSASDEVLPQVRLPINLSDLDRNRIKATLNETFDRIELFYKTTPNATLNQLHKISEIIWRATAIHKTLYLIENPDRLRCRRKHFLKSIPEKLYKQLEELNEFVRDIDPYYPPFTLDEYMKADKNTFKPCVSNQPNHADKFMEIHPPLPHPDDEDKTHEKANNIDIDNSNEKPEKELVSSEEKKKQEIRKQHVSEENLPPTCPTFKDPIDETEKLEKQTEELKIYEEHFDNVTKDNIILEYSEEIGNSLIKASLLHKEKPPT